MINQLKKINKNKKLKILVELKKQNRINNINIKQYQYFRKY